MIAATISYRGLLEEAVRTGRRPNRQELLDAGRSGPDVLDEFNDDLAAAWRLNNLIERLGPAERDAEGLRDVRRRIGRARNEQELLSLRMLERHLTVSGRSVADLRSTIAATVAAHPHLKGWGT